MENVHHKFSEPKGEIFKCLLLYYGMDRLCVSTVDLKLSNLFLLHILDSN